MKKIKLLGILLLTGTLYAQEINLHLDKITQPNYGLAVTGTGMTLCAIGTTMNQSPQQVYYPKFGSNYVNYDNQSNRALRLSTMAAGALITLAGILIQNKSRRSLKS